MAIRLAALVLCGAHRADRVMVGGKWVVIDGAIPGLDVPDLIRRHSAAPAMHGIACEVALSVLEADRGVTRRAPASLAGRREVKSSRSVTCRGSCRRCP